jgi:hypothetical protein
LFTRSKKRAPPGLLPWFKKRPPVASVVQASARPS